MTTHHVHDEQFLLIDSLVLATAQNHWLLDGGKILSISGGDHS